VAVAVPLSPRRKACASCGQTVLAVYVQRQLVLVEVGEETPVQPCPRCRYLGLQPNCQTCGGRGRIGRPLPDEAVALREDGHAREWDRYRNSREPGEALHVRHACVLAA
jgi:hypothetical protein